MSWPKIVLLAWIAYSALSAIARIGKPSKPKPDTHTLAMATAVAVVLLGAMAWLVVIA